MSPLRQSPFDRGVAATEESDIEVELLVHSGLPNPTWTLSDAQDSRLLQLVNTLTRPQIAWQPPASRLGYAGIVVSDETAGLEVTVADGCIYIERDGETPRRYADPGRSLERWLLDTGRHKVDRDIFNQVRSEIGSTALEH